MYVYYLKLLKPFLIRLKCNSTRYYIQHIINNTHNIVGPPKIVHVLHNSEHPASVFSILETGTKQISMVADSLFDLLILKMSPVYITKKLTKIESKGPRFELSDFIIKFGSVTSQTFKGVLVEVNTHTIETIII